MWYVIQVQTRHELDIIEKCRERVLLPTEDAFIFFVERERKIRGEWKKVIKPAFPGYVFIDAEDTDDLRIRLRAVKEMTKILSFGEEFLPVYEEEKDLLLDISDENRLIRKSYGIKVGDRVVITDGSLFGYESRIVWVNIHKRECGIEMNLLGKSHVTKFDLEIVEKRDESMKEEEAS